MAITRYRIKKWTKMLLGRSLLHVPQPEGSNYSFSELRGYYNDLTNKVTRDKKTIASGLPPLYPDESGKDKEFSIGIFQYALGAYDLYLASGDPLYRKKFYECVRWGVDHQREDGSFHTFDPSPIAKADVSSMAQSQAASMFFRAYVDGAELDYLNRALSSLKFMLRDEKTGGCTRYSESGPILMEYPLTKPVLNGWIFSLFGLIDAAIVAPDQEELRMALDRSLATLKSMMPCFVEKRWSFYNEGTIIASPFYHRLHINLLSVIAKYTGDEFYNPFISKWRKQQKNPFLKFRAMYIKLRQKAKE